MELCLSSHLGGLELSVIDFYNYFKAKTNCYFIVAPNTKLDKNFQDKNKFTIKRNKFFPIFPALKLAKFVDANNINVIHFHWGADIITAVLAKLISKNKPKIIYSRHMHMTRFKHDIYHRFIYRNIDMLHAITNRVKKQLELYIPDDVRPPISMIYHGVSEPIINKEIIKNLQSKYNINDEFVVGMIGRIEKAKGQHILIDAVSKLQDLNIKTLLIGHTMDKKYLNELKEKVKNLKMEEKILFTGFTRDVNEHIKLCDAAVLATKNETFGLIIIETMINRVCSIATNNGGPLEIIDNNENGLLFDRDNNDLASKITFLYNNKDKKESLADAGYEKAQKEFNHSIQMQKLYDVISEKL